MKFFAIFLLPLAVTAFPASSPALVTRQTPELEATTDRLLFSSTMSQFQSARNAQNPAGL
jgi:hypothetical protein